MENEKIGLTHKLWAKILAVFVLTLSASLTAASSLALACAYYIGSLNGTYRPENYELSIRWIPELADHFGYWWLGFAAVGFIGFAVCLVFLCCAAGHRGKTDQIFLNFADRIPVDLYFCFGALAAGGLLAVTVELSDHPLADDTVIFAGVAMALCLIASGLIVLAVFLSLVTRIKYGGWWKNSIAYYCLRFLWRLAKAFWSWLSAALRRINESLPIIWRTALFGASAIAAEAFLTSEMIRLSGLWVLLWLIYNLIIFSALCFGAYQMKSLKLSGERLAAGDLSYQLDTAKMYWEFKNHGENLNSIANGMARAVEERLKSERLKTELITNVSHDIKTPLTSIVSYVDLLQKEHTPEQEREYLEVLARQSSRLKKLTEDLVEASKAATGNISVNLAPTNIGEMINQSLAEYAEKLSAGGLEAVTSLQEPLPHAMADGRLLWRVMDNLLNNVCKYALSGTRVYADARADDLSVVISVKNISRLPLNVSAEELLERFVRGDASRNTEGSGLGLSIARSLVELQKGGFDIETDGDLFKATITLPRA